MIQLSAELLTQVMAVESLSMEQTANEIERVWFVKISDFEQFTKAPKSEIQEQWEYKLERGDKHLGTLRSRSLDNGDRFELTIKVYRKDGPGVIETNLAATDDVHETIKALADRVIRKVRYVYPVSVTHQGEELELCWEIDAFLLPDGEFYPWIKIDFEIPDPAISTPKIPFQYDELINASFDATLSSDEKDQIDTIYRDIVSTT